MTGLEKIIKAIETDAKANADAIIAQAKSEAENIISVAKKETEEKCSEIAMQSEMDVKSVLSRAESAARLLERKLILDAKLQMIQGIIEKAMEKLNGLPDSDYFDVILKIVKKHAHNKPGEIVFSSADQKRLPKDFEKKLGEILKGLPEASLAISKETINISGGCILVYGDVEENCSFEALFSAAKEELQDKVNQFLFEKDGFYLNKIHSK